MAVSLRSPEARILSRPFPVRWAGWESTTTQLSQTGWQLAIQMNYFDMQYQLAMYNDTLQLSAITNSTLIEPWVTDIHSKYMDWSGKELPTFFVTHCTPKIYMSRRAPDLYHGLTDWMPIDGRTQITYDPVVELVDLCAFARLKPKETLIPHANMSVVEQLEAIIKAQEPKQHELRQLILAERRNVRQIASIAEVD